jgi:hypothetical protein
MLSIQQLLNYYYYVFAKYSDFSKLKMKQCLLNTCSRVPKIYFIFYKNISLENVSKINILFLTKIIYIKMIF